MIMKDDNKTNIETKGLALIYGETIKRFTNPSEKLNTLVFVYQDGKYSRICYSEKVNLLVDVARLTKVYKFNRDNFKNLEN